MNTKQRIEIELNDLFVKQKVDYNADNVKAAMITAAAQMALATDIVSPNEVIEKLSVDLSDNAKSLIGLSPQFVKQILGYSVNFNDYASATVEYNNNKDKYDRLYNNVKNLELQKERHL